jgi:hypothetical protein
MDQNAVSTLVAALLAAVLTLLGQKAWGDVSAFRKQQAAEQARRHRQQLDLVDTLLSSVEHLREVSAHNAQRRGELLLLPVDVWKTVFFRDEPILPPDKGMLEAVAILLIQADEVNTLTVLFHGNRTVYATYRDSVVKQCSSGEMPGPNQPYNIPATLNLVKSHLERIREALVGG